MTEDKADKALRKVIINLIPREEADGPVPEKDLVKIDISDKLQDGTYYSLGKIEADYGTYNTTIRYVPFDVHEQFKHRVECILDATIVNSKQRASLQKILNTAFYDSQNYKYSV